MKAKFSIFEIICFVLIALLIQLPFGADLAAQANLKQPTVSTTGLLNVTWTAGTLNSGGHAIAITASSLNVTASKTDCSAPLYASCNLVYSNSSGTVANTSTLATATAAGNVLMAMAEANGTVITKLSFPNQNGAVFLSGLGPILVECGTSAACSATQVNNSDWTIFGSSALSSASPSTASISAMTPAFTSTATYWCTATPNGTTAAVAAAGVAINKTSGSAFTITGPNTVTTVIDWRCTGH